MFRADAAVSKPGLACYVWGWELDPAGNLSGDYDPLRYSYALREAPGVSGPSREPFVVIDDPEELGRWVGEVRRRFTVGAWPF